MIRTIIWLSGGTLLAAVLLYLGARYLGWWTIALIGAGVAWEFVKWPGWGPGGRGYL